MPEVIGMLFPEHNEALSGVFPAAHELKDPVAAAEADLAGATHVGQQLREKLASQAGCLLIRLDDGKIVTSTFVINIPEANTQEDI